MLLVEIFLLFVLVYDKVGVNAETKLQNLRGVAGVGKNSNYLQFPESEKKIFPFESVAIPVGVFAMLSYPIRESGETTIPA